jgi:hypothetical protein
MLRILLILVLLIFAIRAVWRLLSGVIDGIVGRQGSAAPTGSVKSVKMERDPVCGTFVVPHKALTLSDGRDRLYFCSAACRDAYRAKTA